MNRFRICLFIAMIVLMNLPSVTQADQITPNPNPLGSTIFVNTLLDVNETYFQNYGNIQISSSLKNFYYLINFGTINNDGTLTTYTGASLRNNGTLTNRGRLVQDGGTLYNYGTLHNYGTLTNRGTLINHSMMTSYTGSSLTNSSELQNYGTLSSYGTLSNSGSVINNGTLNVDGTYTQTVGRTVNTGSMTATSLMINGGKLDGNGLINNSVIIGSGASVNPGVDGPVGKLTINGPLISSGTLFFDIRGLGDGKFDVLDIKGNTVFTGGTVQFNIQGYKDWHPSRGDHWDFLLANSIKGWDTLNFVMNGTRLKWKIIDITGGKQLMITEWER
jgi:hypothetical protein